jgi:hypothetical protein
VDSGWNNNAGEETRERVMTMNDPHANKPLLVRWKADAPGLYNDERGHDTTTTTTARETMEENIHKHQQPALSTTAVSNCLWGGYGMQVGKQGEGRGGE